MQLNSPRQLVWASEWIGFNFTFFFFDPQEIEDEEEAEEAAQVEEGVDELGAAERVEGAEESGPAEEAGTLEPKAETIAEQENNEVEDAAPLTLL